MKSLTKNSHSKYNARKIIIDGLQFDSRKEANRYAELSLLEKAGKISGLKTQVKFELIPKQDGERACNYIADFVYTDAETGKKIVEDVKGYRKGQAYAVFTIKRKLMLWVHGIKVKEV